MWSEYSSVRKNKAFTETFRTLVAMLQRLCSFRNMGKSIPRQSLRWLSSSILPLPTPAIPPGLLQYLEKKEQEESYGRSQSQLANLHSALRRYSSGSSKADVHQIKNLSSYCLVVWKSMRSWSCLPRRRGRKWRSWLRQTFIGWDHDLHR